jgi:hypothetical protein
MPNTRRVVSMDRVKEMREQIQIAVAKAADGNPYPLIILYQELTKEYGHSKASGMVQRFGLEVFA